MGNIYETLLFRNLARKQGEVQQMEAEDVRHAQAAEQLGGQRHEGIMQQHEQDLAQAKTLGQLAQATGQAAPDVGEGRVGEMADIGKMVGEHAQDVARRKSEGEMALEQLQQGSQTQREELKGIDKFNLEAYRQEQISARAGERRDLEERLFGPRGRGPQWDVKKTVPAMELRAAIEMMRSLERRVNKKPWDSKLIIAYQQARQEVERARRRFPGGLPETEGPPAPGEGEGESEARRAAREELRRKGQL